MRQPGVCGQANVFNIYAFIGKNHRDCFIIAKRLEFTTKSLKGNEWVDIFPQNDTKYWSSIRFYIKDKQILKYDSQLTLLCKFYQDKIRVFCVLKS